MAAATMPHRSLQIRQHVSEPIGLILREMKGVSLPIQLHAVPIVVLTHLADVGNAVLPHLGH